MFVPLASAAPLVIPSTEFKVVPTGTVRDISLPTPINPVVPAGSPSQVSGLAHLELSANLLPSIDNTCFRPGSQAMVVALAPYFRTFFPRPMATFRGGAHKVTFRQRVRKPTFA